jgi:1,2-diacylglycerol 3-beta-galactosyltransferase
MALQQVIAQQGRPWEIRMVNLQEQLDNLDIFRRITGIRLQDYYNLLLKKGWTIGSAELLKGLHVVIRLFQPALVRMLSDFWRAGQPDMVVSLIPNFDRSLKLSLEAALPGTPLVTILTDIADYPPHLDRAPAAVSDLRLGSRGRPGAGIGTCGSLRLSDVGYDPEPALLCAH